MKTITRRAILAVTAALLTTATVASAQAPGAADGSRFSASAEYLLWWMKDSPAPPPLLSTGGVGDPDFSPILGDRNYDTGAQQGGRFTIGYQLTPDWAVEAIGFFLADTSVTKTVSSSGAPGSPRLLVPVYRVEDSREGYLRLADPGDLRADARESLRGGMHGVEANVARKMMAGPNWRVDVLGGFRYLRLREQLTFSGSSVFLADPDIFMLTDSFETDNHFYGGQIGIKGRYTWGGWFGEATAKIALGVMHQSIETAGVLVTNDFNETPAPLAYAGGVFAQATNSGSHSRDRFAVVPEVGLKVGYRLTPWASVFVGYTFMYASAVVRPGNQIDRNVNTTQVLAFQIPQSPPPSLALKGDPQPAVRFRESDFWVQGLNVGLSFSY